MKATKEEVIAKVSLNVTQSNCICWQYGLGYVGIVGPAKPTGNEFNVSYSMPKDQREKKLMIGTLKYLLAVLEGAHPSPQSGSRQIVIMQGGGAGHNATLN